MSYDKFQKDGENIYRMGIDAKINETQFKIPSSQAQLGATLKSKFPAVESFVRLNQMGGEQMIKIGERKYSVNKVFGTDSSFFDIFTAKFLVGNSNALKEPRTAVVSREFANKYFKSVDNAMGKSINIYNKDYNITAVIEDSPYNTHFKYNVLCSQADNQRANTTNWFSDGMLTYIKLKPNTNTDLLTNQIQEIVQEKLVPIFRKHLNMELGGDNYYRYYMMPMRDIHLHSHTILELEENGNITHVNMFIIIALFILLIACINFSNLSTAKASTRAREIGIKKALGSGRKRLMAQFFTESIFICFISFILAIVIVETCLPLINSIIGVELQKTFYTQPYTMLIFIGIAILTGIISGLYSAVYLSSFNPVKILKGELTRGKKNAKFRGALVIFQFAISIFLIICTLVVNKQFNFIQNSDLGYNKHNFIKIKNLDVIRNQETFKDKLLEISGVEAATLASDLPGKFFNGNVVSKADSEDKNSYNTRILMCDDDFLKTMECKMAEGRFLSREFSTDSTAIVINETAAREMNISHLSGTKIQFPGGDLKMNLIGIIKDFHNVSLKTKVQPLVIMYMQDNWGRPDNLGLRLSKNAPLSTIRKIEEVWNEFSDGAPLKYSYFEDIVTQLHIKEKTNLKIFTSFSIIAIFIALIGLLGLVSFTIDQKVKEIGIRKILGAPVSSIIMRLNMDIIKWIAISFLIACPTAYFLMDKWLQNFIYRIDIGFMVFVLSGLTTLVVTLSAVSWQALRAAQMNPVDCLRSE
jgi:putative ABC transport system permease protein